MTNSKIHMALVLAGLMVLCPWLSLSGYNDEKTELFHEHHEEHTNELLNSFTTSEGFIHTNMTTSLTGVTGLKRPDISWTSPSGMGSLLLPRAGGCSGYLPSLDQVYFAGGRGDPNPLQTGDEAPSNAVDIFYNSNKTWWPSPNSLTQTQEYHGCATVNNKIYMIGDFHPGSNPSVDSEGLMQVFDPNTGNWSLGTNMPTGSKVGLAGVESHNNMIYVAGGVSKPDLTDVTDRLMRYDPVNNNWTQLASMNHPRHSFQLISFQGKLIAYGGIALFFDPVANTTVYQETNLTEAYDPLTNSWTQLINSSKKLVAYSADVFNEEIIIHGGYQANGWQITKSDKTYAYNPFTNQWKIHTSLPYGVFDSSLVQANNTLVFAGGDTSNSRFSSWSIQYIAEGDYFANPSTQIGWLTSPTYDFSSTQHGSASPIWLGFSATEPNGTYALMQYRTSSTESGISTASWKPTTAPVYTYLNQGNASLSEISEDTRFLQYRIKMSTNRLLEWVTPNLLQVSFGGDEAAFTSPLPQYMQPTATALDIITHHHASTMDGEYQLALHATDKFGSFHQGSTWTNLTWNTTLGILQIDDPSGLLLTDEIVAQPGIMEISGQNMTWEISLSGNMPTDYIRYKVSTHAERNATYMHPDTVPLDKDVKVEITSITADYSSEGDDSVSELEVLPSNTQLNVSIDHFFNNSGLRLLGGNIQSRLHTDIKTFDMDSQNLRIWSNSSTQWFDLPSGEMDHILLNLPEGLTGEVNFWLEVRTSEDWNLISSTLPHQFHLNGEGPTLLSVDPTVDEYTNEDDHRVVTFEFHDFGGFTSETFSAMVWIEGRDDGGSSTTADGIAQLEEYKTVTAYVDQNENIWSINITVNDTINDDHEWTRVLLDGTDAAGFALPSSDPAIGHARWESRTPLKSVIEDVDLLGNLMAANTTRIEPSKDIGYKIVAFDTNGIDDISEIKIELGSDDKLGLKYTLLTNTCASLDERLIVDSSRCSIEFINGRIHLEMWATVDWSFSQYGLAGGVLEVIVLDKDGVSKQTMENRWSLQRDLSIDVISIEDKNGPVKQQITDGVSVKAGDELNLTASVSHLLSETPYEGALNLQWRGKILGELWLGGTSVTVNNGDIIYSIPTPIKTGMVKELEISLWDPLGLEKVASFDVSEFMLDGEAPELLSSNMASVISRFHLEEVNIGVNIREGQGWSSPLSLTCQVRSLEVDWDPITLQRNSTTVFDGKTMFSFVFDFSDLGDPSELSSQASLACWAEGSDDSGWDLVSAVGNSNLDPWLTTNLNSIGPDLKLEAVEVSKNVVEGETVRISFSVVNAGESLPTQFNTSIEIVKGDERTLVGRSIFYSMNENSAKSIQRSFAAPAGTWSLVITVDQEGAIWELDEGNNQWNETYTSEGQGLSALVVATGGFSVVALIGGAVLLRRRNHGEVDEEKIFEALGQESPPDSKEKIEASPKQRGPPGAKISQNSGKRPTKGPPRGPPKASAPAKPTPQEMAALHMDALTPMVEGEETEQTNNHASDYSQLPGGGEYEYTLDATYYVGEECGRWILNEDKSFTKIDEND